MGGGFSTVGAALLFDLVLFFFDFDLLFLLFFFEDLTLNDLSTVQELMHIREHNGKIEGQDGYHDDHSDALMLAEWNRRKMPQAKDIPKRGTKRYHARRNPFNVLSGAKVS